MLFEILAAAPLASGALCKKEARNSLKPSTTLTFSGPRQSLHTHNQFSSFQNLKLQTKEQFSFYNKICKIFCLNFKKLIVDLNFSPHASNHLLSFAHFNHQNVDLCFWNVDNGLFITLVKKVFNNVFLFVSLTTLGTSVNFDW